MRTINFMEVKKALDEHAAAATAAQSPRPQTQTPKRAGTAADYTERKARAVLYAARAEGVPEGQRNQRAYRLAAALRERFDLDEVDRLQILRDWNARNSPPLGEKELAAACRNPDKYAQRPAGSGYTPPRKQRRKTEPRPEQPQEQPAEPLPLIDLSAVKREPITWQWPNRFPTKGINLVPGIGSAGKTTLAAYIAATLTTGRDWPDNPNPTPPGSCLFITNEDDPGSSICPKLDAAGADTTKTKALNIDEFLKKNKQSFNLSDHIQRLDKTIEALGDCRAVFFDPLNEYLGRINSFIDAEVRSILSPLVSVARKHGIAIYALCHLSKKPDLGAVDRVLGSVAFVNIARAVWFITWDKKNDTRYLTCEKANYCINPTNLSFRIVDGAVAWLDGTTDRTADDVLQSGRQKSDGTLECIEWLRKKLSYQSVLSSEISEQAKHEGFSRYALDQAKRALKVQAKRDGFGGKWRLCLPESAAMGEDMEDIPI